MAAIAGTLVGPLGGAFVLVSAPIGALGTMLTGSTTASNALFSSLQAEVAAALSIIPARALPAVTAVGTAATGATGREGEVLRHNLGASMLLLLSVIVALVVQVWLLH